jgi:hypothetical protein
MALLTKQFDLTQPDEQISKLQPTNKSKIFFYYSMYNCILCVCVCVCVCVCAHMHVYIIESIIQW